MLPLREAIVMILKRGSEKIVYTESLIAGRDWSLYLICPPSLIFRSQVVVRKTLSRRFFWPYLKDFCVGPPPPYQFLTKDVSDACMLPVASF